MTADGKQLSLNYIDQRLESDVGKKRADKISLEMDSGKVGVFVSHIDESGNVSLDKVDDDANVIEKDVKL